MEQNTTQGSAEKKGNGVLIGTVVALVVAVASYGLYKYIKKDNSTNESVVNQPETSVPSDKPKNSFTYKDGVYSAVGDYVSPGGDEQIGVSLTIKDDVVVDGTVEPKSKRPVSLRMQNAVASNFKPLVIGKKLDEVSLDRVSGSSLTPEGFNNAVTKIKAQAKI